MKGQGARLLLRALGLLVLVPLILAMVGCGDGGGGGGGDKDAIALMKKLPQGTDSFMFVDVKTLRTDDDLKDLYDNFDNQTGGMSADMFGVSADDVDAFGVAGEMVFMMQGDFDLEDVRDGLQDMGYDKDAYEDVEIWETLGSAMVLVDDSLIIAAEGDDAKDCIDVIKGKDKSLYEASGVKDDMGKLPGDSLMVAWGGGGESFFADETYTGLEATAISMSKKNADTVQATAIMRFKDSASAKDAMDDVKADMEEDTESEVRNVKVTQDGEYIKATAEMDLDENLFG